MRKLLAVLVARPKRGRNSTCVHCGRPSTKEAHFKESGGSVVEKYCDICIDPPIFKLLQRLYQKQENPGVIVYRRDSGSL